MGVKGLHSLGVFIWTGYFSLLNCMALQQNLSDIYYYQCQVCFNSPEMNNITLANVYTNWRSFLKWNKIEEICKQLRHHILQWPTFLWNSSLNVHWNRYEEHLQSINIKIQSYHQQHQSCIWNKLIIGVQLFMQGRSKVLEMLRIFDFYYRQVYYHNR